MTPANLTDAELLRLYDDLFRQHPATAELAMRLEGGGPAAALQDEFDEANEMVRSLEKDLSAALKESEHKVETLANDLLAVLRHHGYE